MKAWKQILRLLKHETIEYGEDGGRFQVDYRQSELCIIASFGMGWDHVSVHVHNEQRCPSWEEMCYIKDMFFKPGEWVIQYHPAKDQYVNCHERTLHLWRPLDVHIPTPPLIMV